MNSIPPKSQWIKDRVKEHMSVTTSTFHKQVKLLCSTIEEMGKPFQEKSEDLLVLDTRDIMDSSVAESVRQIEAIGSAQYQVFVTERFEKHTSLFVPIKRNMLSLFQ